MRAAVGSKYLTYIVAAQNPNHLPAAIQLDKKSFVEVLDHVSTVRFQDANSREVDLPSSILAAPVAFCQRSVLR
jgi:hypothetical protein